MSTTKHTPGGRYKCVECGREGPMFLRPTEHFPSADNPTRSGSIHRMDPDDFNERCKAAQAVENAAAAAIYRLAPIAAASQPVKEAPAILNQCDGCARGLPVVNGMHRDDQQFPTMACTADRYAHPEQPQTAQAFDFVIEKRGKFWILDWAAKGGEGCRPASEPEIQMWQALSAQPEQAKKGNVQQSIIGWLCSRDSTVTVEVRCENLARYVSRDEDYKPLQRWIVSLYADGHWRSYQWRRGEGEEQPTAEEREAILLKLLQNAMGA